MTAFDRARLPLEKTRGSQANWRGFAWAGIDYLGEASPYMTEWPSRGSYFGILDTCGFPKDRSDLYEAQTAMT